VKVAGVPTRTIRVAEDGWTVEVIDQTLLPFELVRAPLRCLDDAAEAIREMRVRGAPLIGVTAAYGVCLALREDASDAALERAALTLQATRPTGVNLRWALAEMRTTLAPLAPEQRVRAAYERAAVLCDADVAACRAIGEHGLPLLEKAQACQRSPRPVNVLTHCNAGWLACVDWGTALAPIYRAHDRGMPVHVWVDETRPRNQGASLTAWELAQHGVPHTVIVDNAGGHLMQRGQVDLCLVGTDRTTANGDVCNKIGTYLKALAAHDNGVPFYVAVPSSSIDWEAGHESGEIPIEERDGREVSHLWGRTAGGERVEVALLPEQSGVANHAFDVTPARLVTALVTERGVCAASREGLMGLYAGRRDPA
jgi:methylthioribose-1-phosphate isomerase